MSDLRIADTPRLAQSGQLELAARRVLEGLRAGRHRSPYLGPATEFADHRPYLAGDDLRTVDWKAYARSDHLLVRRYREERDLPLLLLVDSSASMDYGEPRKADWAVLAAATLGLLAVDQGDRVALAAGGDGLAEIHAAAGGPPAAQALCARLAGLRFRGGTDLARTLQTLAQQLRRRSLVVLLSDALVEPAPLARAFGALGARGHEGALLQVLDRSELSLPADWGEVRLEDPELGGAAVALDSAAAKAGYDARMARHIEEIARACAGCRVEHVLALTDRAVADALGAWLHRRRRR